MLDLLFRRATVIDGTGESSFAADVGVVDGRIVLVGAASPEAAARRVVDCSGLCLAPGFIDPHGHSDVTLLADPGAHSKVRQGVTTEVVGNCGFSPAPIEGAARDLVGAEADAAGVELAWSSMAEYRDRLSAATAMNVVTLVGHNTVRGSVLGYGDERCTQQAQGAMERLVDAAMADGARGLSTGLFYPPGSYAGVDEVIGIARRAAAYGGLYTSHIRSESDGLLDSIAEAVAVGEGADIYVEISHLKIEGARHWDERESLFSALDDAASRGVRLGCDAYPYRACCTWLPAMLPYWAQAGGSVAVAARLRDSSIRAVLRRDWETNRAGWEERMGVTEWADILVTVCPGGEDAVGATVAELAADRGVDGLEVVFDLIVASGGQATGVWFDQAEENVAAILAHPLVIVGSDGYAVAPGRYPGGGRPHPRSYGTFPRVLGRYVRELCVLSLEEAVRKMTSLPAERFGLADRGVVRQGLRADLVAFDPATVGDRATYAEPERFPVGIPFVAVNGVLVVDGSEATGARPGLVL